MLVTLYGPDSYRRIKKLNTIIIAYRDKYTGLSYERFDMSFAESLDNLKRFAGTPSMFDPVRLAVADNPLDAEDQKEFRNFLKANKENKDLTIVINSSKKPPVAYKFIYDKPASTQEFQAPKGEKLKAFISQIAEEEGTKLSPAEISALADLFGSDTWAIATEISRLAMASGEKITAGTQTDYFQLINTLKRGPTSKDRLVALELILSERKDEPARVFNSLAYRLGTKEEANRFADYDVAVKSGDLEYEEVLLDLAIGS